MTGLLCAATCACTATELALFDAAVLDPIALARVPC